MTGSTEGHGRVDGAVRRVLDAAGVALATLDSDGHLVAVNPSFARLCGRGLGELVGLHVMALCPAGEQAGVLTAVVRVVSGVAGVEQEELRVVGGDGRVRVLRLTLGGLPGSAGGVESVLAVAEDLTDERRRERRRRTAALRSTRAATEDVETGLPNERALALVLASAIRRSARTGAPFAVIRCEVVDLDGLERRHGSATARAVLSRLGQRLRQGLRSADTVARTGTASFTVVAEDLGDEQDAAGVAYRLLASVMEPVIVDDTPVEVAVTVGAAVGDGRSTAADLLAAARSAASRAGEAGTGGFRLADLRGASTAAG